jgi:putative oxidoreductase
MTPRDLPSIDWQRWAVRYARVAIGAAFLSAVAGRFGLWTGAPNWSNFERFIRRTAELNPFLPEAAMPLVAWAATGAETVLGLALIAGVQVNRAAFGGAALLAWFGIAMAATAGPKSPLDYSVFSASAGALLLALGESRRITRVASLPSGDPKPGDPGRRSQ